MKNEILVVEDDQGVREAVVELLECSGYKTYTASNGSEALLILHGGLEPGLILLNMNMPVMGGRELINEMKKHVKFLKIPVTVVSCNSKKDCEEGERFITKPFDISVLLKEVERFCGLGGL